MFLRDTMTKSYLIAAFALLMLSGSPAAARDDGGFGMPSTSKAPAALGDNTAELIARGDIPAPEGVAGIEPAAGDDDAELINGIPVPREPDQGLNSSSLAGIDSNANGIRDDVERFIATKFGTDPVKYDHAKSYAIKVQALMANPTEDNKNIYIEAQRCPDLSNRDASLITEMTVDTVNRESLYANTLAGARTGGGC